MVMESRCSPRARTKGIERQQEAGRKETRNLGKEDKEGVVLGGGEGEEVV